MDHAISKIYEQEKSNINALISLSCYYPIGSKKYKEIEKIIKINSEKSSLRKRARVISPSANGDFTLDYIIYYNNIMKRYGGLYKCLTKDHPLYAHMRSILSK